MHTTSGFKKASNLEQGLLFTFKAYYLKEIY